MKKRTVQSKSGKKPKLSTLKTQLRRERDLKEIGPASLRSSLDPRGFGVCRSVHSSSETRVTRHSLKKGNVAIEFISIEVIEMVGRGGVELRRSRRHLEEVLGSRGTGRALLDGGRILRGFEDLDDSGDE